MLGAVVVAGVSGGGDASGAGSDSSASSTIGGQVVGTDLTVPQSTLDPLVVVTDPGVVKTQLTKNLGFGSAGEKVKALQQRLKELGFDPGPADGSFGNGTRQAVWAFEKLTSDIAYDQVTGVVTNDMWQMMQDDLAFQPLRQGAGTHVEIYLPRQVLIVFKDNKPELITHISSGELNADGTPKTWCETLTYDTDDNGAPLEEKITKAMCAEAKTPGGVFRFTRRYEGNRVGPLGGMWNPVYFNYGIAVHGAKNVPDTPASHGCIRIPMFIADYFPDLVKNRDLVYVWGFNGKEPENNTKNDSLPSFNRADPNATTTTSSTTTTSTTTPATTTTVKSTTTTAKPPSTTTTTTTTVAAPPGT